MSNLIPFEFDSATVRVVEKDSEALFVAHDVALALDYRDTNALTRWLDADEKGTHTVRTPGGEQQMIVINESGLYSAILRSRKAEARRFKKWVTSQVLPTIRQHGRYEAQRQPAHEPDNMTAISRASAIASALDGAARAFGFDDNMRLLSVNQAVHKRTGVNLLEELGATDLLSPVNERYMTPTELGLPFDMSAVAVNRALRDLGYQRQERDGKGKAYWLMTERGREAGGRMMDTGKKHGDGTPVQQLKWPESVADVLAEEAA
ncbi:Bro-N domain-containing protein [Chromohalobacter moromii]|uniref:Bro-N domain-containing protein n=1 Tax=Chromohalobacter moromii TaxID=2860329 RepID=A0A9X2X407_9GAMM|nr:Bro-N domain-containing protein [Chromohalobacter moromii]MCT8506163.1 Bro-N domain-containing protein [Chromohalobacter moromii]